MNLSKFLRVLVLSSTCTLERVSVFFLYVDNPSYTYNSTKSLKVIQEVSERVTQECY